MTQQESLTLKPGTKVCFVQDADMLQSFGIGRAMAGRETEVVTVQQGNDTIVVKQPNAPTEVWYIQSKHIILAPKGKQTRFSRKEVESFMKQGSNDKLKSELTIRIQAARTALTTAVVPKDFNNQMKVVTEQLRQARLIRQAIKE